MIEIDLNRDDVQGNILRGYRRARVRYLIMKVADARAARQWLATAANGGGDGVPAITTEAPWEVKPDTCFNVGMTYDGLKALGVSQSSLDSFPTEFTEGMAARAVKLGDIDDSSPDNWPEPFDYLDNVQIIFSIYADEVALLDREQNAVESGHGAKAFKVVGVREGFNFDGDNVHFGYRDNISQPRFIGIHDPERYPDKQPQAPVGTVLLGHETEYEGLLWDVPQPSQLGLNGSYNAFRILAQDVAGFEAYLDETAAELMSDPLGDELLPPGTEQAWGEEIDRHGALREIIAAKMCGRWRNGTPLEESPLNPNPEPPVPLSDFDYGDDIRCPFGAHVRRCNPRGGHIVQRIANNTRRLVRRGVPYGPAWQPGEPDGIERGLLGNFIGADLGAQFEAVMCDWLNLGLQDPRITGTNDPLLGANEPETSWFDIQLRSGNTIRLKNLPRFTWCRGGAYTFLPSLSALRYIGSLNG